MSACKVYLPLVLMPWEGTGQRKHNAPGFAPRDLTFKVDNGTLGSQFRRGRRNARPMDRFGPERNGGQTSRRRDAHPRLTREAIWAALAFAKEALRADVVYPVAEAVA